MKAVFNNQFRLRSGKNKGQMRYAYRIVEATDAQVEEWIEHPRNAVNAETNVGPMLDGEGIPMYIHIDESLGKTGVILIDITTGGAIVATSLAKEQQDAQLSVLKALASQGIDTSAAAVMLAKEAGKDITTSRFQLSTEPKAPITKTETPAVKKLVAKKPTTKRKKAETAELNPFVEQK